uniref:TIL domain-containing protein n=1 Tax=Nippostrongylus brasiliensis TaxID=27835 RepID=A0A0N4YEK2_NIPBR
LLCAYFRLKEGFSFLFCPSLIHKISVVIKSCSETCGTNEQYNECGSACEPSCKNPKPEMCTMQCVVGCQCKSGFFRDDSGQCVAKCSSTEPSLPPCSQVKCPKGTKCLFRCQPDRVKRDYRGTKTCATMKCPPGTKCEQETINCFVAPCPQPDPRCV